MTTCLAAVKSARGMRQKSRAGLSQRRLPAFQGHGTRDTHPSAADFDISKPVDGALAPQLFGVSGQPRPVDEEG